jgi:hypothetical protein
MRGLAWCTLLVVCLSCEPPPPDVEPLADPAPGSRSTEATPDSTSATVLEMDEMPWPTEAAPAVKALFAGSWEPREPLGFDQTWFDEADMLSVPESRLAGRRTWRGVTSQGARMLVDPQIRDRTGPAIAYTWWMLTWDEVVGPPDTDLPAVIHFRHSGRVRVWFDGQLIIDETPTEDGSWNTLRRAVELTGSDDVFLVKSARGGPELGPTADFELCVTTPGGGAFPGQIWQTVRVW